MFGVFIGNQPRQLTHFIYLLVRTRQASGRNKLMNISKISSASSKTSMVIYRWVLFLPVCKQFVVWSGWKVSENICDLSAIWFEIQIIWIEDLQWKSVRKLIAVSFNCQISTIYILHMAFRALHHFKTWNNRWISFLNSIHCQQIKPNLWCHSIQILGNEVWVYVLRYLWHAVFNNNCCCCCQYIWVPENLWLLDIFDYETPLHWSVFEMNWKLSVNHPKNSWNHHYQTKFIIITQQNRSSQCPV